MKCIRPDQASEIFLETLHDMARESGTTVNIGLCGGRSIASFYDDIHNNLEPISLAGNVKFFLTDEKYEDATYYGQNTATIRDCLFQRSYCAILNEKMFFGSFLGKTDEDIQLFNSYLRKSNMAPMDILVLGAGEDGHIAGIFPHPDEVRQEGFGYVAVKHPQKEPKRRITMSPEMIRSAKAIFLFFIGEDKRGAFENFMDASKGLVDCPAKLALGANTLYVVTDLPW